MPTSYDVNLVRDSKKHWWYDCEEVDAELQSLRAEVERLTADGCKCQGCGTMYTVDVSVPDETWERIKPEGKPEGAGLLCPQCVADRLVSERDKYKTALDKIAEMDKGTFAHGPIGKYALGVLAEAVKP